MTFQPHVKTFWCEPTGRLVRRLRRYRANSDCAAGYHNASATLDIIEDEEDKRVSGDLWSHDDPRWPVHCEGCHYLFQQDDSWQLFVETEYRGVVSRDTFTLRDAPPGAMWDADWLGEIWRGDDGRALICILPNRQQWWIDSRANNCTKPDEPHHCWIRHGDPTTGVITVDKDGPTCDAGAGSVQAGDYHGFLVNGEFNP